MNYKKIFNIKIWLIPGLVIFLLFTGCSQKSPHPPVSPTPDIETTDTSPDRQDGDLSAQPSDTKSLVEILAEEARKFFELNENREALMVYNQALNQATGDEIPGLIHQIEQVLIKTDSTVIENLIADERIVIPRPMLLYWLGVNYFIENQYGPAQRTLQTLCAEFPNHFYYQNALELLSYIKKDTFKKDTIGCVLPLSGKYALFGQKALEGIEFAIQKMSEKYNYPFKVIIKDTRSDEDNAAVCVQELSDLHVAGIAGPIFKALDAGKEAQKNRIPMIAMTQNNELASQGDFLFTNSVTPEMQVRTLVAYSIFTLGISRFAILYPDEPYGRTYMNLFWDAVKEFNGTINGVQAYGSDQTDFSEAIKKLSGEFFPLSGALEEELIPVEENSDSQGELSYEENPEGTNKEPNLDFDALFIPDSPGKLSMILPQLAFNDIENMYLLGTNLWHHDQLLRDAKGYYDKAVITEGFFINSSNARTRQFSQDFNAYYKRNPDYIEAIAFDTASILFEAAMDPSVDSHDSLRSLLRGKKVFEGVTGRTIFNEDGTVHKELFLVTIKKDRFVEISR